MNVIFLDIDGVLNDSQSKTKTPNGFVGIDDKKVKALGEIAKYLDAKIVLSSTWKNEWSKDKYLCSKDAIYMINKLKYKGNILIYDKINETTEVSRGWDILQWIRNHNVDKYIILDDFGFDFLEYEEISSHVIKTLDGIQTAYPLMPNHVDYIDDCIKIINNSFG